jgi:putative sigma-54 modulation protein
MKLQIHSIHFDADVKLLEFIQKTEGEVFLKLDKGEHSRENKVVEMKIGVPGATLFAKAQNISFEAAADDALESLRRQIHKHKEKLTAK